MLKCLWAFNFIYSAALFTLGATKANAEETNPNSNIQLEKAYQQVLFEYYQGNFARALTQMAVLEQRFPQGLAHIPESLSGHQVEPELLKGGLSLVYGLDNQAADIFSRLLASHAPTDVTAYAWLLLGKTYYQNRQFSAAAQAFEQISLDSAEEFFTTNTKDHWLYMQSQLHGFLLEEQAGDANIQWLEQLSTDSIYRQYVEYNQALALLQTGNTPQAIAQLTQLANHEQGFINRWAGWIEPLFNTYDQEQEVQERETIRDRANLTLAYTLLQNDQPHKAFNTFENIHTDGLDAEAALLGYGWAAAKKGELQVALAIWQKLMQLPNNSEYTLEAFIASAYAYEQAFAPRQSLQVLELAVERFQQALTDLNRAQAQVNQRQFILDLLPDLNKPSSSRQGVDIALSQSGQKLKALQLFNSVAISSEFRTGLAALQNSYQIQRQLQSWQQRMQQYDLMLDERQAERVSRAQRILKNRILEQLSQLQQRRDALAHVLARAISEQNGQIFMGQQSQNWLARVERSEQRLDTINLLKQKLDQGPLAESYQRRVARVKGRLLWQASEALPANKWQGQKALSALDKVMAEAKLRQQTLLEQLAAKPDLSQQRQRVSDLAKRIDNQLKQNTGLQNGLIKQLSDTFNQFIQSHKEKVGDYILQAQLAMVRLNDQALQKDNDSVVPVGAQPVAEQVNAGDLL